MWIQQKTSFRVTICLWVLLLPLGGLSLLFGLSRPATAAQSAPLVPENWVRAAEMTVDCGVTTWVVSNTSTLNEAIDCFNQLANGTGLIQVTADIVLTGTTNTITNSGASLLFAGNGHTVDGNGVYRVLSVSGGIVTIEGITLTNGYIADSNGGGLLVDAGGVFTLTNSTVISNTASAAGGIRVESGYGRIEQSLIAYNRSLNFSGGGLVVNDGAQLVIDETTFHSNAAATQGGGFRAQNEGTHLTVTNSTIYDNVALVNGGGFYIGDAQVTMINSTVSGNRAVGTGGGIHVNGIGEFIHSSIVSNTAVSGGGGIWVSGSETATLSSTLLAYNTASADDNCGGVFIDGGYNLASDASCAFTQTHSLTNTNPLLLPLADNGGETWTHALAEGSPALDTAGSGLITTDQRGISRPQGNGPDIGAYEWACTDIATPWLVDSEARLNTAIDCFNEELNGTHIISFTDNIVLSTEATNSIQNGSATLEIQGNGYTIDGANT